MAVPAHDNVASVDTGQIDVGNNSLNPCYIPAPLQNGGNKGCKEPPLRSPHPAVLSPMFNQGRTPLQCGVNININVNCAMGQIVEQDLADVCGCVIRTWDGR